MPFCTDSPPEVFLEKDILKISSKFTGEYPYRYVLLAEELLRGKLKFLRSARPDQEKRKSNCNCRHLSKFFLLPSYLVIKVCNLIQLLLY